MKRSNSSVITCGITATLLAVLICVATDYGKPKIKNEGDLQQIGNKHEKVVVAENNTFRIYSPEVSAQVGSSIKVVGQARVFEAVFGYSLEDGHNILAEGHVQASQGAPAWGDFEFEVQVKPPTNLYGMLILYEESAKDGSRINKLMLPVQFNPELLHQPE